MIANARLERPEALAQIRAVRAERGYTLAHVAEKIGLSPVYVGAVFSGQAMLTPAAANALATALDLPVSELAALTEAPVRNSDPFVYRLHEMCEVYGDA